MRIQSKNTGCKKILNCKGLNDLDLLAYAEVAEIKEGVGNVAAIGFDNRNGRFFFGAAILYMQQRQSRFAAL